MFYTKCFLLAVLVIFISTASTEAAKDKKTNAANNANVEQKSWFRKLSDGSKKKLQKAKQKVAAFFGKAAEKLRKAKDGLSNSLKKLFNFGTENVEKMYNSTLQTLASVHDLSVMGDNLCGSHLPPFLKSGKKTQESVCVKNSISDMEKQLKNGLESFFSTAKDAYKDSIKNSKDDLQAAITDFKTYNAAEIKGKDCANSHKILVKELDSLDGYLKKQSDSNLQVTIGSLLKCRQAVSNFIPLAEREENEKLNDMLASAEVINELTKDSGNIKMNLIQNCARAMAELLEHSELQYDGIKNKVNKMPKTILKINEEDENDGIMNELKQVLLDVGTDLLDKMKSKVGDKLKQVMKEVETTINDKKMRVCKCVKNKVNMVERVGNMFCTTLTTLNQDTINVFKYYEERKETFQKILKNAIKELKNKLQTKDKEKSAIYTAALEATRTELLSIDADIYLNMNVRHMTQEYVKSVTDAYRNITTQHNILSTCSAFNTLDAIKNDVNNGLKTAGSKVKGSVPLEDEKLVLKSIGTGVEKFVTCTAGKTYNSRFKLPASDPCLVELIKHIKQRPASDLEKYNKSKDNFMNSARDLCKKKSDEINQIADKMKNNCEEE